MSLLIKAYICRRKYVAFHLMFIVSGGKCLNKLSFVESEVRQFVHD